MLCLWCHEHCGDQGFCGPDCYEAYEAARDEYNRKSQADALLEGEDKPTNESFGTKGNQ